jgi:peroxiredoxin 2/4
MSTLVQHPAPTFTASAVLPDGKIDDGFSLEDLRGKYVVLFFYPLDFTFVCPSEILAFDKRVDAFEERNCQVIGVSVDSAFTHAAWRKTAPENGGIGPVRFPLVADLTKHISRTFGVLSGDAVALRATFLLDRDGVIRHQAVNDLGIGRDVDETLRTLDALIHHETSAEVCPAGWTAGDPAMEATSEGVAKYLKNYRARL